MSRYRKVSRIATGGMGEVWRAEDTVLGRTVALKLLKPEYAEDARFRERFETEARHAASLQHPHIATVYDFGEGAVDDDGVERPYLVMELVEGRPLSELIRGDRRMDPERVRDLVRQAAEALAVAHDAHLVHRDVKPANLLVTPKGQVKVTDFGIARAADASSITGTGEVIGTPHYLSPEQARGDVATPASDVYALGVVLFECLTGRRPYSAETPVATALAHLRSPVPELPDDVPADLAAITRRAMAKDVTQRYPDAGALVAALDGDPSTAPPPPSDALSGGEETRVMTPPTAVLPAVRESAPTAATPVVPPAAPPVAPASPPEEPRRRSPVGWVVAGVLVVALAVVGGFVLLGGGSDDTPTPTPSTSPSASESAVATHEVNAEDYVGSPYSVAESRLRGLGFDSVRRETRTNPGGETVGDVAAVSPTGSVREDRTIVLTVWGSAEPSESPSPSESTSPSASSSPSSSPSASASEGGGGS